MNYYVGFWIFWLIVRALIHGNKSYNRYLEAGYNFDIHQKTGQFIPFHGGLKERIPCTIAGALGLLVSPVFLLLESVYCIPAVVVLYFISR